MILEREMESPMVQSVRKYRLVLGVLLLLLLVPMSVMAQLTCQGKVVYGTLESKLLPGYPERNYAIYLPKSYERDTTRRYPVLYLLHGGMGSYIDWPQQGNLEGFANEIINSGMAQEMIIVCPDGKMKNTMWFNIEGWPGQDHFFEEFLPYIDSHYRTKTDRGSRAIAGLSMGGGGSIVYATSHPELFSGVYAVSSYVKSNRAFSPPDTQWLQDAVNAHNGIEIFAKATPEQIEAWKNIAWFIDCGDDDFTYDMNIELVSAMRKQQIPYELRIRDGAHTWQYWMTSLYTMLPFVSNVFYENQ